jgi:DNA-binding MarR family transcriptional regulator
MSKDTVVMRTEHIISLISRVRDKANRLIVSELRVRNMPGLAPSHGDILILLFQSETVSMREIAKQIGRDKSTVTALIKKLINIGYVEKREDPNDSRVTLIKLTKEGLGLKQNFEEISETLLKKIYRNFSKTEKEMIIYGLEKIDGNL